MNIEPGKYLAHVTGLEFGFTKKGTEQIEVALEIDEGPMKGRIISWFGYFSEKAAERSIQSLRTLGWKGDDLSTLTSDDIQAQVEIVVEEDTFNGYTFPRVKWINSLKSGMKTRDSMDQDKRKAFAERMRGLCMATKSESSRPVPPPPPCDDDIPF